MVSDPAHEIAKIRPVLERIALALESIAKTKDSGFKTKDELGARREAERQKP